MNIYDLTTLGEDLYLTLNEGTPYIWIPASGEVTTLKLAAYNLSYGLSKAIESFNMTNGEYIIEPIDYALYDTYATLDAGLLW